MNNVLSFWICVICANITIATWTISSQKLPQKDDELAVGAYNGTIFIIGGVLGQKQLTTYDIETDTLTDVGTIATPQGINGDGQYWTQVDHIMFMIDRSSPHFNIYNMISRQYSTNWNSIIFNIEVSDKGCLASDSEYLYITGGQSSDDTIHNELQILSLSTYQWLNNAPSMNEEHRGSHACVVHSEYLWVFGGDSDGSMYVVDAIKSNERISTIDITLNSWHYIDPLTKSLAYLRATAWFDIIYVIGGDNGNRYQNIVHLVDVNTGTVNISPDNLPLRNSYGSPIIVDAVLYIFGGFQDETLWFTDDWAYYPLATPPVMKPTSMPSMKPSDTPTENPSNHKQQSLNPTSHPSSSNPSLYPTHSPFPAVPSVTLNPTSNPLSAFQQHSLNPTVDPSYSTSVLIFQGITLETLFKRSITDVIIDETEDNRHQNKRQRYNNKVFVYIAAIALALVALCVVVIFCVLIKYIKQKKRMKINKQSIVEMETQTNIVSSRTSLQLQGVSHDIRDTKQYKTTNIDGGNYNIAEDEFVIVGEDEENTKY